MQESVRKEKYFMKVWEKRVLSERVCKKERERKKDWDSKQENRIQGAKFEKDLRNLNLIPCWFSGRTDPWRRTWFSNEELDST